MYLLFRLNHVNCFVQSPKCSFLFVDCLSSSRLHFPDAAVRQANWSASKVRDKLRRDIDSHASSICSAKLSEIMTKFEVILSLNNHHHHQSLFPFGGVLHGSNDAMMSCHELSSMMDHLILNLS